MIKKIKLNKTFVPMPIETGDEIFPNGIFLFNITKLLNFIKARPDQFTPKMYSILDHQKLVAENLNEAVIAVANLEVPILLAEISPGKFNVIDGNHRVEKARRLKKYELPAFVVRPDTHIQFMTTQTGYEAYIRYWNEKAATLNG